MTARKRLTWWLCASSSFILTGLVAYAYGDKWLLADHTYISFAIVGLYVLATIWIGWAIHFGRTFKAADYWTRYLIAMFPAGGLIGTLIGIAMLFGLGGGAVDDNAAILGGLGTAVMATLAGLVYSELLILQLHVLDEHR
jgi:hypothetical protein